MERAAEREWSEKGVESSFNSELPFVQLSLGIILNAQREVFLVFRDSNEKATRQTSLSSERQQNGLLPQSS